MPLEPYNGHRLLNFGLKIVVQKYYIKLNLSLKTLKL